MMKVKRTLCVDCDHPADDHSVYRELCLHAGCPCTNDIHSAQVHRRVSGLLIPDLEHIQRVGTPAVKEVLA